MRGLFLGFTLTCLVAQAWSQCDQSECHLPECLCTSTRSSLPTLKTPQFVMLTFDDSISDANFAFYRELLSDRANRVDAANQTCRIGATFFVSGDYLDYRHVNTLYNAGSEIALHSITHLANQSYWKNLNTSGWESEIVDQRKMVAHFAQIPEEAIVGMRAPFLQSGGDVQYEVLKNNSFVYDCSLPVMRSRDQGKPVFPFTMDYGWPHSCMIPPCPHHSHPGLWSVPMNMLFRKEMYDDDLTMDIPCSMADACPPPITANQTFEFLMENFNDFYRANRAPFPLFLHEAWLKEPERKEGYLRFVDEILAMDDTFIVTINEVIEYLKNPVPVDEYKQKSCTSMEPFKVCAGEQYCYFEETPKKMGSRVMWSCNGCPKNYPWINNYLGQ